VKEEDNKIKEIESASNRYMFNLLLSSILFFVSAIVACAWLIVCVTSYRSHITPPQWFMMTLLIAMFTKPYMNHQFSNFMLSTSLLEKMKSEKKKK